MMPANTASNFWTGVLRFHKLNEQVYNINQTLKGRLKLISVMKPVFIALEIA
jgi:hypothetical protein